MFNLGTISLTAEQLRYSPGVVESRAEAGLRPRTRRAILDAAVRVLAESPSASVADVAAVAGVGRTTVHRYFPERSDLLAGIEADLLERIDAATRAARTTEGPAGAALRRLCEEYFTLGDVLTLVYQDPTLLGRVRWTEATGSDLALLELVERGQREGEFDPAVDASWVCGVVWSLLFTAWLHARDPRASTHETLALCLETVRRTVAL